MNGRAQTLRIRQTLTWAALAVAGLAISAVIAFAASTLSSQEIGLESGSSALERTKLAPPSATGSKNRPPRSRITFPTGDD